MKKTLLFLLAALQCGGTIFAQSVEFANYGKTSSGESVEQYTIKNKSGMTIKALTFGGTVTDIIVPDKYGRFENVVLNLPSLADYEKNKNYMGPIIGRFGNRLAKSQFEIGGKTYKVPPNEGENALHGGPESFDKKIWKAEEIKGDGFAGVKFSRTSPDGEMGFPGNLKIEVSYVLDNENRFTIQYKATTDKPTVCNFTWHPYINLAGAGNGSILTHQMFINSDFITEVDDNLIPTGRKIPVENTPFDFNLPERSIGEKLHEKHPQLEVKMGGGAYDHNFELKKPADTMGLACVVYAPKSGRMLTLETEEPCMQLYTGQGFDGTIKGANQKAYYKHAGFVVEPQHHPDQPNQKSFFPSTLLTPGEEFTSKSVYTFSVFDPRKK